MRNLSFTLYTFQGPGKELLGSPFPIPSMPAQGGLEIVLTVAGDGRGLKHTYLGKARQLSYSILIGKSR